MQMCDLWMLAVWTQWTWLLTKHIKWCLYLISSYSVITCVTILLHGFSGRRIVCIKSAPIKERHKNTVQANCISSISRQWAIISRRRRAQSIYLSKSPFTLIKWTWLQSTRRENNRMHRFSVCNAWTETITSCTVKKTKSSCLDNLLTV